MRGGTSAPWIEIGKFLKAVWFGDMEMVSKFPIDKKVASQGKSSVSAQSRLVKH